MMKWKSSGCSVRRGAVAYGIVYLCSLVFLVSVLLSISFACRSDVGSLQTLSSRDCKLMSLISSIHLATRPRKETKFVGVV